MHISYDSGDGDDDGIKSGASSIVFVHPKKYIGYARGVRPILLYIHSIHISRDDGIKSNASSMVFTHPKSAQRH